MNFKLILGVVVLSACGGANPEPQCLLDGTCSVDDGGANACAFVKGSTFYSVSSLEVGERADGGVAYGTWSLAFADDLSVSWYHSDLSESGQATCSGLAVNVALTGRSVAGSYDSNAAVLTFDGQQYKRH